LNHTRFAGRAAFRLLTVRRSTFLQAPRHVLVQHAGDQGLVGNTLFERFDLNVVQVAGRQADIHPLVFESRSAGRRADAGQQALGILASISKVNG